VWSVGFSPDGAVLASGGDDGVVRLWRAGDGALLRELTGHTGQVRSVAFSPDGAVLASGGADGVVRLWDTATGRLLATLVPLTGGGWAVILDDGRYKLAGAASGEFWYMVNMCRFEPGEADDHLGLQRLPADHPILGAA
jgi:WD40 repeat protein